MPSIHKLAQLLMSSWTLSGAEREIPTSHGIFDQALKKTLEAGALPEWAEDELHFVESRVGLRCVELVKILALAQDAQLSKAPNPSYRFTEVQISPRTARALIDRIDVSERQARDLGRLLRRNVGESLEERRHFLSEKVG